MNNCTIFSINLILFACYSGFCQSKKEWGRAPSYSVTHYTDESGLPQNSVKSIVADDEGFIWLATENGLVRFDGRNFKVYDRYQLGTPSNRMVPFQPDMSGLGKLLATSDDTSFVRIHHGKPVPDSTYYHRYLQKIPFFEDGARKTSLSIGSPNGARQILFPDKYVVPFSGKGEFYFCHHHKIEQYVNWQKKKEIHVKNPEYWNIFRLGRNLFSLNKNGTVTLYNASVGQETKTLKINGDLLANQHYKNSPEKLQLYWNNASDQVFLYLNNSLYSFELTRSGAVNTRLLMNDFDFEGNFIISMYYDAAHRRIFLGSLTKGLFVFSYKQFSAKRFNENEKQNVFYGQGNVGDNKVMVPLGYLMEIEARSGEKTVTEISLIKKHNLHNQYFFTDRQGNHWGRRDINLYKFSADGKKVLNHWKISREIEGFYQSQDDLLWIITLDGKVFTINPLDTEAVPQLFVVGPHRQQCITVTKDTVWLGTQTGLYQISTVTKKSKRVPGTANLNIRSLYFSAPGRLWFTTYEDGFFLYENGRLIKFPLDKNYFLNTSHCIVEDGGYFWIPTNKGLFRVLESELLDYAKDKKDKPYYHRYSKKDGFNTNEFNGGCEPCALKMGNGFVSLPSLNGLVWFKPESTLSEIPDKQIFLDQVSLNGKPVAFGGDSLHFPFNPMEIRIEVSSPYFGDVNNLNITYRLSENGKSPNHWQTLNNSGIIEISHLNSGEYMLFIKKKNGFGGNSYSYKTLKIFVKKAWYETAVFRIVFLLIGLILAFTLFYGYLKNRIKNIQLRNYQLEKAIEARTKDLQETLQILRQSNHDLDSQIHSQSGIVASITHDVRGPLNSIIYVARHAQSLTNNGEYEKTNELIGAIVDTSTRMKFLLDNLLDYVKIKVFQDKIEKEYVDLYNLVEDKFSLFNNTYSKSSNVFVNDVKPGTSVHVNHQMIAIIIHNLIDNANKYTYKGQVRVYTEIYRSNLHLIISDTGCGMAQNLVDWLNAKLSDMPKNPLSKDRGLGLVIIREVAELTGIGLWAHTGSGTRVEVIFHDFEV